MVVFDSIICVAQSAARGFEKPKVGGSIPPARTVWCKGNISVLGADDVGSIPTTQSRGGICAPIV